MNRISLIFAATLMAAFTGCRRGGSDAAVLETAPIKRGDITQIVTASGQLSAVVSVDVGSQISGRIQALHADFNSPVTKGQVIAEIDPSIYQAVVDQSKGELASAEAALELARLTADRKRELAERKAGTQADADKARAELRQAQAMVQIKQAMLEKAKADLDHCHIIAPVDGLVISRKVDVGQTVAAAMTTPVFFTIAQDISKMQIIASVSEADIGQIAVGQKVDFSVDAFPEETFQGAVTQVRKAPATTENVVTYETVIAVGNPEQKLFPGMTAEVSIHVAERKNALAISNAALRFAPPEGAEFGKVPSQETKLERGERLVYLPAPDRASLIPRVIKAGITNGVDTEVVSGLREGDGVVTAATAGQKKGGFAPGPPPGAENRL